MSRAVINLAELDPRPFVSSVTILTAERPNGSVRLKLGEELFVVAQDRPVMRPGYKGPDDIYCVGEDIGHGQWPVMLCKVRSEHAAQWVDLDAATANRFLVRARRRLADANPPSPRGRG